MVLSLYFFPCFLLFATAITGYTDTENYRLPKNIIPSHYRLELIFEPKNSKYSGFVEITVTATDITNNTVELHASPNYLTVKRYALLDYSIICNITNTDNITEIITLTCPEGSLHGEHKLELEFSGELSTGDKVGVFRSSYLEDKKEEVVVATNFEPIYARRAFPCFDEPSFKATFDIFVTRPDSYKVLANTPEEENFNVGVGQLQSKFTTTPLMSTYLVAFAIFKFDATTQINGNYSYNIYARSSVKNNLGTAVGYGLRVVEKLDQYTGISYENLGDRQLDQVILPDATVDNVENWGLTTYREADLLDEGNDTPQKTKQRIITTMTHELAQQWFADYVTPDWWSDAWLSEGFATYFQYFIADMIDDVNFELENQFVVDVLQNILQKDGPYSSPLSNNETDINSGGDDLRKLDDITYYKGASVVRMIKGMAGEKPFQQAIQKYLKKHRYNSTSVEEFLQEIVGGGRFATDFAIKTWIYQRGYPILSAEYDRNRSYVIISQEPFDSEETGFTDSERAWYIPVSYTTSEEKDFSIEMKDILVPGYRNRIDNIGNTSWLILNLQHHGYYRVNYDDWLWDRIIEALNDDRERRDIHALNRAQLLDDIFALAQIGKIDYQKVFDLAEYLRLETDYYPWVSGLNALTSLGDKLADDHTEELLQNTIRRWWTSALEKFNNETPTTTDYLKEAFFTEWSCKLNLDDCIDYTNQAFSNFKTSGRLSDYNKRATVFCYGLRNSSDPVTDYKFLLDLYQKSTSADERNDAITGMGCSLDDEVLSMYLAETMSNNSVFKVEDVPAVYRSVYMSGEVGLVTVLQFAFDHAPDIVAKYEGKRVLTSILTGVAPKLRTSEQMGKVDKIVDYYSEIDDILICDWQVGNVTEATKRFSDIYGDTINDILTPKVPSAGYLSQSNIMFTTTITLAVFLPLKI